MSQKYQTVNLGYGKVRHLTGNALSRTISYDGERLDTADRGSWTPWCGAARSGQAGGLVGWNDAEMVTCKKCRVAMASLAPTVEEAHAAALELDAEMSKPKFYRTGKGKRAHASIYCANSRRSVFTGYPTIIPESELAGWVTCGHCSTGELAAPASAPEPAPERCKNSGVTNPQRIYSLCRDCGKEGAVNRSTGSLQAHKPLPADQRPAKFERELKLWETRQAMPASHRR